MTDTIKTSLCLKNIPQLLRMNIPAQICNVSTPWGELVANYTRPTFQRSSMSNTKTKWVVRCEPGDGVLEHYSVPVKIEAEINIPNAIAGQNVIHGTSVYAAALAALHLQRNWLAEVGLPREYLDLLSIRDVELTGVTVTFIIPCLFPEGAAALIQAMLATGKALYSDRCTSFDSSNTTVNLPGRDFSVTAYIKSEFGHCKWADDAPVTSITEKSATLVRIESKLGQPFLAKHNLRYLDRWKNAYEKNLYKWLFDATVRKTLRLNDVILRHKAPREEVFNMLTPTEAKVLRGYLATPPLNPRKSDTVVGSLSPEKRFYELRKPILERARIDIDIPWKEHIKLRCFELDKVLRYPGDFHPAEDHAHWAFCESNWPQLQAQLDEAYEVALAKHAPRM